VCGVRQGAAVTKGYTSCLKPSPAVALEELGSRLMTAGPRHLKVLVTGCGRSGTRYTTFLFRRLGLDVLHERLGRDGIASWTMAVSSEQRPYGPPSSHCSFEHVFHQLRNPLEVIRSVTTFGPESWAFICAHTPCRMEDPVLLRAATYWLYWTDYADRIATWRYRIEAIDAIFPELCERLGVGCDWQVLRSIPRDVNTRSHGKPLHLVDELGERLHIDVPAGVRRLLMRRNGLPNRLTSAELDALGPQMAGRVRLRAASYGYEVEKS
jgi:hypothetical protein